MRVDDLRLDRRGDESRFRLEAVARADFGRRATFGRSRFEVFVVHDRCLAYAMRRSCSARISLGAVAELAQDVVGIGAEVGRRPMNAARVVGELDRKAEHVERPWTRMLDRDLHLLVADLRILEYLRQAHHAPARHARGIQHLEPVRDRLLADLRVDERVDRRAALEAVALVRKSGCIAQVREAQRVQELEIDLVVGRRDRDLAVGGLEQAVRRDQRVVVAGPQRLLAGLEIVRGEKREVGDHAVGEARRHFFALARALAPHERGADAHRRIRAGDEVGQRRRSPRRRLASAPLTLMKPLIACAMKSNGGPVAVRAVEPEAGDVAS